VELIGTDECENYFKYYKAALGGCGKEEDLKFEDKIIKNVLKEVQIDKSTMTIQWVVVYSATEILFTDYFQDMREPWQ